MLPYGFVLEGFKNKNPIQKGAKVIILPNGVLFRGGAVETLHATSL